MGRRSLPLCILFAAVTSCSGGRGTTPKTGDGGSPGSLTLTAPYSIPAGSEVTYECYATTVHPGGTVYINSFTPHEGMGTHHIVLFVDHTPTMSDGMYPCQFFSGTQQTIIYAAGIGGAATVFPTGVGYALHDGDQLILQLHELNASSSTINDMTSVDIGFITGSVTPAQVTLVGPLAFSIPPVTSNYVVNSQCSSFPAGTHMFAVFPHMHQIGTSIKVSLDTASGLQTLAYVNPWSFTEQPVVNISPAAQIAAGGKEYVQCTYNNPGTTSVNFGQSSNNEMCFGITYFYPATAAVGPICIN